MAGVFNNFACFCLLISLCGLIDHQPVNAGVIQSEEETVENRKVFREQARAEEPPQMLWEAAKEGDLGPLEEAPPLPEELPVPKEVSNVLVEDVPEEESHVPKEVLNVVNVNGGAVESAEPEQLGCVGELIDNMKGQKVCKPRYHFNCVMEMGEYRYQKDLEGFLKKRDKTNGCPTCCYCEHKCKCTQDNEECELDKEGCPLAKSNGEHICKYISTKDEAIPEMYYKQEADLIV